MEVKDLCICLRTIEKSLAALEESLFTKVAVEEGEEDEGEPNNHDQPELLVSVHLIPDGARLHVCRTKFCALQNPLTDVADHSVVIHLEHKVGTVDDPSHGDQRLSPPEAAPLPTVQTTPTVAARLSTVNVKAAFSSATRVVFSEKWTKNYCEE